jgi:hypothetical protein
MHGSDQTPGYSAGLKAPRGMRHLNRISRTFSPVTGDGDECFQQGDHALERALSIAH